MTVRILTAPLLAILLLATAWALGGVKLTFTETSLGVLAPGGRADLMVFSADGKHVAYPAHHDNKSVVVVDGVRSKEYEWVQPGTVAISADGARVGFVIQRGDKMLAVIDGEEGKEHVEATGPVFSPDGKRVAYLARSAKDGPWTAVIDGVEGKGYEKIHPLSITFSPDGKHVGYIGELGQKRFWVIDGQEGKPYELTGRLEFSANSARWAHVAQIGTKKYTVVSDGKEGPVYDLAGGLAISPDGKRLAFVAEKARRLCAVIDGEEKGDHDKVSEPIFSPDSQRIAYFVMDGRTARVVLDDTPGEPHDMTGELRFSGDSQTVGYTAMDEKRQRIMIGRRSGAAGAEGRGAITFTGGKDYEQVVRLAISPDGKRIAHAARNGADEKAVIDGKELPGAGHVTMNPDGRYVAHSVLREKKAILLINEVEGKEYDGFLFRAPWVFAEPDKLQLIASRNKELLRVEVKIEEE